MIVSFRAAFFVLQFLIDSHRRFSFPSNHCINRHSKVEFNSGKPIRVLSSFRRIPSTCPWPVQQATASASSSWRNVHLSGPFWRKKYISAEQMEQLLPSRTKKSMIWYVWPAMYWIIGLFLANHQCLHLPCKKKKSLLSRYCWERTDALTGSLSLEFGSRVFC